jgi:hypothetical protein
MHTERLTQQQMHQLLDVLGHYMGPDIRQRLMAECPRAYNAWCGREVVHVVRVSDGDPVRPPLNGAEAVLGQREHAA